jgi:hypothetical protein
MLPSFVQNFNLTLLSNVEDTTIILDNTSDFGSSKPSPLVAPFVLTLDPSYVAFNNKIRAIEYIWGDGTSNIINFNPNAQPAPAPPLEAGSPVNYPQTHIFYSKDPAISTYIINVKYHLFGQPNPIISTIKLILENPSIFNIVSNKNIFNLKLIKTRMFGVDNKILYTFNAINADKVEYVLMATTNWKPLPVVSVVPKSLERPYTFTQPFEKNTLIPSNSAIRIKQYQSVPINPDSGTTIIKKL